MELDRVITLLRSDSRLSEDFVHWRSLPAQSPQYAEWPDDLDERIVDALSRRNISKPYVHQATAIRNAIAGRDQVVVTPTASGKTLCYQVPVIESILRDPSSRALYLFPTKALAHDQLDELHSLVTEAKIDVKTFTYDGDTTPSARMAVRSAGHIVITNPDMLHTGILPNHTKWMRLFENLRYVIIDELHTYRGVFGSQVANVIRRLRRICRFYGTDPIFICCSATIANPVDLATAITGQPMDIVADDSSGRGERIVALYNPPIVNRELGLRRSVIRSAVDIASVLQRSDVQTLMFAGSRTNVELATGYLRAQSITKPGAQEEVRGYRSGYLPTERREIEAALRDGQLRTVVATNALELGIDIGGLDAAVLAGYPGTLASMRQQMGRAGRRGNTSLSIFVAGSSPIDQFIVQHPEYVFDERVEAGLINPDNPIVSAEHLKCAIFELPLESREHESLGSETDRILEVFGDDGTVHANNGRTYWSSEAYPAHEVSLRQGPDQNVVIVDQGPPARVIGEVDRSSAMTLVHNDAIYIHDGHQYHVDKLDWDQLKAYVRPVNVDYYTDANLSVDLKVLSEWESGALNLQSGHGEVAVSYLATMFKKIKFGTHDNVGWGKIRLPQDDLHTGAFWLALSDAVTSNLSKAEVESAIHGLGHLLVNVAPLLLMCDPRDLHLSAQTRSPHTRLPTIFLWERVPGGVGFGHHLYQETRRLLSISLDLLDECYCTGGCPGCVGPPPAPQLAVKVQTRRVLEALCQSLPIEHRSIDGGKSVSAHGLS